MLYLQKHKILTNEEIGAGPTSKVFAYATLAEEDPLVIKCTHVDDFYKLVPPAAGLIMSYNLDHPMILPIQGFYLEPLDQNQGLNIYQQLPRMKESFEKWLERHRYADGQMFREEIIVKFYYSLICALEFLHKKGIAHRNMKLSNILLDDKENIKLTDICQGDIFRELSGEKLFRDDLWSLGVIITEMCFQDDVINKMGLIKTDEAIKAQLEKLKGLYSDKLIELISLLLVPSRKVSASEMRKELEDNYPDLCDRIRISSNLSIRKKPLKQEEEEEKAPQEVNPDETHNKNFDDDDELFRSGEFREATEEKKVLVPKRDPMARISQIKQELSKFHRGIFTFERDKVFAIRGVRENWIDDKGIKTLMADLETRLDELQFRDLEDFDFAAMQCPNVTDEGLKYLATGVGEVLKNLKNLTINVAGSQNITDEGINNLQELAKLNQDMFGSNLNGSKLQSLAFIFRWCRGVTDKGMRYLAIHIGANFKSLQNLDLDFRNCPNITSEGVKFITTCVRLNLKKIQELRVRFAASPKLDDSALQHVASLFDVSFQNLETVSFSFVDCNNLSVKAVKGLISQIKEKGQKLRKLTLDFPGCTKIETKIDQKTINSFKDTLSFIPRVELSF